MPQYPIDGPDDLAQSPVPGHSAIKEGAQSAATEICFLLLDNFSLLSFSSAIEPLRIANKIMKRKAFNYICCTIDGRDALASSGGVVRADCALRDVTDVDLLAVCSSDDVEQNILEPSHKNMIRQFAHRQTRIAGICTGAYVLAGLGLLNGRQCTIHWEYADLFKERFPDAGLVDSLIQADGRFLTCAGGTTALDLMIGYIAELHGGAIASDVASIALHQDMRSGSERQNTLMRDELNLIPRRLRRCIELMTENVGETLSQQQLADKLNVSPRQLQRDFQQYLGCAPLSYYSKLRLDIAQRLVCRTTMPMVEIAVACGFANASHFAKRYRALHGKSPIEDRQATGRIRSRKG
ncbi:GlxA family transcriptional regulator [Labrenzia sp. PHM005]|uniref:GlxA family transcriptional regulator n=1 Tax=Labrenzia sp. PHM005 TaxID=2590016 RepID=UPI001140426E|nr:GlxA family transcriptional regulator [Labrenzia sp. PHM005]QDG79035.1 GlxA family transcriptional regulator [Labrenzia sp. PHM005]